MRDLPIHWREGQFLHPQHFQAADRYWTEVTTTSQQWDHPYNYGVHKFAESFAGTLFRVDEIQARMQDGTLICRDRNDPPLTVELEHALVSEAPARVFLCVPELRKREVNVSAGAASGAERFVAVTRGTYDENQSGDHDQEIEYRDLNVRLLLSTDDLQGYERLPIAQVRRGIGQDASPQLDERYIPPVFSTNAWSPLGDNVVRYIYDLLLEYALNVTEKLRGVHLSDHILEVSHSVHFALLDRLNETSTAIGALLAADGVHDGVHPFTAYVELCRVIGKLALFTDDRRPPELPRYDHDSLGPVFQRIRELIRTILESIRVKDVYQKQLVWDGEMMRAELSADWFDTRVEWLIGVRRPKTVSDADCRQLLSGRENNYLMKFGGSDQDIYQDAAMGLRLKEAGDVSERLPPQQYWTYWRVLKSESEAVFRGIDKTRTLVAYLRDHHRAFDANEHAGTNHFSVADSNGELIRFELTLFGEPQIPS